jgi:hypothetical protein
MSKDSPVEVPEVLSLSQLKVYLPQDVYNHLARHYGGEDTDDTVHLEKILECMKISPAETCCRVNLLKASADEVADALNEHLCTMGVNQKYTVQKHETIRDIVTIKASSPPDGIDLYKCSIPPETGSSHAFSGWENRRVKGWPMSHRAIAVDRFCGEAVLRGAQIFVKGILCADAGIKEDEEVAVS